LESLGRGEEIEYRIVPEVDSDTDGLQGASIIFQHQDLSRTVSSDILAFTEARPEHSVEGFRNSLEKERVNSLFYLAPVNYQNNAVICSNFDDLG
jgi:hypothetical protein